MGEFMSALAGGMQGAGGMMMYDQQRKKQMELLNALRGAGAGGAPPSFGVSPGAMQPVGTPMQDMVSGAIPANALIGGQQGIDPFIMELMRRRYPGIFGG